MNFTSALLNHNREIVKNMLSFLRSLTTEEGEENSIEWLREKYNLRDDGRSKPAFLRLTKFKSYNIDYLVLLYGNHCENSGKDISGNTAPMWNAIISRLLMTGHAMKFGAWQQGEEYKFNSGIFAAYDKARILEYAVFGVNYIVESTRKSIPAINVKTPEGDIHSGTGVLVKLPNIGFALLTNKHVVAGMELISIKADGTTYIQKSDPIMSTEFDLCAIPVDRPQDADVLSMTVDPPILTPVISIGYPLIAAAADQYALAHRGEINGEIYSLDGKKFLAISNHVTPGNSGGPILNEQGEIVGLVTQSQIGDFGTEDSPAGTYRSIYHLAIPPSTIIKFVNDIEKG